jgi:CRISPR system Cascade subunit CasA
MPSRFSDHEAVINATQTYMGRLVPLTRVIRLADDCRSLILGNGLKYAPYSKGGWREATATLVTQTVKGEPKRVVLKARVDRAVWRELHALVVRTVSESGVGGPLALRNISGEKGFDLWAGGLVANKAKLVDATESVFHVPAAMLGEPSQRIYEHGVRHAETWAEALKRAAGVYHKELGDDLDRGELRERRQGIQDRAATQFWTDIEQEVPHLLEAAVKRESPGPEEGWHATAWGKAVRSAANDAYERACPHETPRQMRAYLRGRERLTCATARQAAGRGRRGG